jgi:TPR repeat protein
LVVCFTVAPVRAAAHALDPAKLPWGAELALEDCYEQEGTDCSEAAALMPDAGWAATLRSQLPEALSGDALRSYRALRCAEGAGQDCYELAREQRAGPSGARHLRATVLLAQACARGSQDACTDLEVETPFGEAGARSFLADPTATDGQEIDLELGAAVPPAKKVKKLAAACDRGETKSCVRLVRFGHLGLDAPDLRATTEAHLQAACDKTPTGSACALLRDLRDPDATWFPNHVRLAELVCSQSSVERACRIAARLRELGHASAWGTARSRQSYGYACDGGDGTSCDALTAAYDSRAAPYIAERCENRSTRTDALYCLETHTMLLFGVGMTKDVERAEELKVTACRAGAYRSCVWMGNEAWGEERYLDAYEWYTLACDGGDGISCGVVGRMLLQGESGVQQDNSAGLAKLREGCDGNAGNACFELGYSYSQARGVTRDASRAADLYQKSCRLGYINGCSSLGVLYMDGRGVAMDLGKSQWLLDSSCGRGFGSACRNMGNGYLGGLGPYPKDPEMARWCYTRGCELEHEDSCKQLEAMGAGAAERPPVGRRPGNPTYPVSATPLDPSTPQPSAMPDAEGRKRPGRSRRTPKLRRIRLDVEPGGFATIALGSQRSWPAAVQASALRAGAAAQLSLFSLGTEIDWISDNRWRPKKARRYWRLMAWGNVGIALPISGGFRIDIGGGGGLGLYRKDPGKTNPVVFSGGFHEYLRFVFGYSGGFFGIKVEQQQLWQKDPGMSLDHVTAGYLELGFDFE